MLRRERLGTAEDWDIALVLSDPHYRPAGARGALDHPIRMPRAATSAGEGVVR